MGTMILTRDVGKTMDLSETYKMLAALREPAALLDGDFGPLTDEQRSYAGLIFEGTLKAQQWINELMKHSPQTITADSLAVLAHKVNSGLTMMIGYSSLMQTGLGGAVSAELAAALRAIVSAGEQAHAAVQRSFAALADEIPGQ